MNVRILSIGFVVPGNFVDNFSYHSDQSLFDADVVIFAPNLQSYMPASIDGSTSRSLHASHMPVLGKESSLRILADTGHWRAELATALEAGKTIFVFLTRLQTAYINQSTPLHLRHFSDQINTASVLPIDLGAVTPKGGKNIKATPEIGVIKDYWKDFAEHSAYEFYFDSSHIRPALVTHTGNMIVGAVVRVDRGHMVLLPPVNYDKEAFIDAYDFEAHEPIWTESATNFGHRLVSHFVDIDRALRSGADATPPPQWSEDLAYRLEAELTLTKEIDQLRKDIESKEQELDGLESNLAGAEWPRWLLYETGPRLEDAILKALQVFGFTADKFKDAESEFDVVFTSPEGRFLGEAEGKNRAINIDKLSQLERNIQEDVAREDVADYAIGVLFGNAHRLAALDVRGDFFTPKCLSGAKRSRLALVRTPDLFPSVRYLIENPDTDYATACRMAIAETEGAVVEFPKPPN